MFPIGAVQQSAAQANMQVLLRLLLERAMKDQGAHAARPLQTLPLLRPSHLPACCMGVFEHDAAHVCVCVSTGHYEQMPLPTCHLRPLPILLTIRSACCVLQPPGPPPPGPPAPPPGPPAYGAPPPPGVRPSPLESLHRTELPAPDCSDCAMRKAMHAISAVSVLFLAGCLHACLAANTGASEQELPSPMSCDPLVAE